MAGFANLDEYLNIIEAAIEEHVELEKLGIPVKLLGMEITWGDKSVKLIQSTIIDNLATEHKVQTIIPTKSLPLNPNDYT